MSVRAVIRGSGSALPAKAVSNAELAERVDTNDEFRAFAPHTPQVIATTAANIQYEAIMQRRYVR